MKSNKFQIIVALLLLILGFVAGNFWQNRTQQQARQMEQQRFVNLDSPSETEEAIPANNMDEVPTNSPRKLNQAPLNNAELATINLFEGAAPSVCFITTSNLRQDFFSMDVTEIPRGTGSGFLWDMEGHIVTNFHVIQGADRAKITLANQESYEAELVGTAPNKDLAVLKIKAPRSVLQPLPKGDSENLRVGQSVYAIGNPFGLDQTLTTGIVSALGREIESVGGIPIRDAIQTDAAINPGNSGGPLLNSSGRLIGVNTAIYSPSGASAGIGFSIPVSVVKWVVPDLIKYGKITRPTLNIEITPTNWVKRYNLEGPLVMGVAPGGAAEQAGIKATKRNRYGDLVLGDIITSINNQKISSYEDLVLEVEKYQPGDMVAVGLLRDGKPVKVRVKLNASR